MGNQYQYPTNFQEVWEAKIPVHPTTVVSPGIYTHGGEPLDRLSNPSSDSRLSSYSSDRCFSDLPSPLENMYPSPVKYDYGDSSLPYDSSFTGQYAQTTQSTPSTQSENLRWTPSSLRWPNGTDLLKRYIFNVPKSKEPYFELREEWMVTDQTPTRVYLDPSTEKKRYPCQYPGPCNGKQTVFNRPADLERHYRQLHADKKEQFPCDYLKCSRAQDPFGRKDHYRDHLRDYHKEDIGSAKGSVKDKDKQRKREETQEKWLTERKINDKWWRCARCLIKNYVVRVGWECPSCHISCEEERIKARERLALPEDISSGGIEENSQYATTALYPCGTCNGNAYIDNGYGQWMLCPGCQPGAVQFSMYGDNSFPLQ